MEKEITLDDTNFNEEIEFVEKKIIEDKFPDTILENILVNEFLKEHPIYLQSDKTLQDEIIKKVKRYIHIYNIYKRIIKNNNYIFNSYYEDIKNAVFYRIKFFVPVVADIKKVYSLFCKGDNGARDETVSHEILQDFKEQYFQLYQLGNKYYNNTISLVKYNEEKRSIIEPYIIPSDNFLEENNIPVGKKITLNEYTKIVQYNGIEKYVSSRVGRGKETMNIENSVSLVEKEYTTTETGESLYIVGFYYIPRNKNIQDPCTRIEVKDVHTMDLDNSYFIEFPKRTKKKTSLPESEYQEIVHKCIPTYKKVVEYTLTYNYTFEEAKEYIQWWGYSLKNLDSKEIQKIFVYSKEEPIHIQTFSHILENEFIQKKDIQKVPLYKNIPSTDIDNIYKFANSSTDKGDLLYIFIYFSYFYKKEDIVKSLPSKKEFEPFNTNNIIERLEKKELTFSDIKNYITKNTYSFSTQEENDIIKKINTPINKVNIQDIIEKYSEFYKKRDFYINYKETILFEKDYVNMVTPTESKKTGFIMKYINSIQSVSQKKRLLYKIIELDGVLIENYVYSRYYKEPLCCGHWYYFYKIENSKDIETIYKNNKILMSLYSDEDKEQNSCTVCSGYLQVKDYDTGYIFNSSIRYNIETIHVPYNHLVPVSEYEIVTDSIRNPRSDEFISYISLQKLYSKEEKLQSSIACSLLDTISKKLGLHIPNKHFIDIVITCTRERQRIQDFEKYTQRRVSNYQKKKKIPNSKIEEITKESSFTRKLQKSYYQYYMTQYGTLVISHLLWYLRCSFPRIVPKNDVSGCSFTSFHEEEGLYYMLCVTMNLKLLYYEYNDGGTIIKQNISKEKIHQSLMFWTSVLEYKYENFYNYKKEKEIQDISKIVKYDTENIEEPYNWKEAEFEFINKNGLYLYKKSIPIQEHINNLLITFKKNISEDYNSIDNTDYNGFDDKYISNRNNEKLYNTILSYLKSSNIIYNNKKVVQNIYNTNYSILSLSSESRNNIFLAYCYEGANKGKLHNFYTIVGRRRCVYCKKYYDELDTQKYTEKEFNNAYMQIQSHTIKEYEEIQKKKLINTSVLKKDSSLRKIEKVVKNIASLISKKCSHSNKKKIESDIVTFFKTIQDFSNLIYKNNKTYEEYDIYPRFLSRLENQYIKDYTIKKLKTYINTYFRKSVQRIKNGYKIPKIYVKNSKNRDDKILQEVIEREYKWLEPFLVDNNKKIFSKFSFNYSKTEIDNIHGKTPIYDKKYLIKIDVETIFETKDVIHFLVFYVASEMQLFMNIASEYSTVFADFCIGMIEEIKKDMYINTIDKEKFEKWKNKEREKFIISQLKYRDMTIDEKDENYNPLEADRYTIENQLSRSDKDQEKKEKEDYYSENIDESKYDSVEDIVQEESIQNAIDKDNFEDTSIEISDSLENNNDIEDYEYEKNEDTVYTESIKSYIIEDK